MSHICGAELQELQHLLAQLPPVAYGAIKLVIINLLQTHSPSAFTQIARKPISATLEKLIHKRDIR